MSIVITGTPGVGKHTVANRLAGTLKLPVTDINQVARESGLLLPGPGGRTGDVDVLRLGAVLKKRLSDPGLVVGHLAPYALSSGQVRLVIVLRRSPYELLLTYEARGYSGEKGRENSASEILGVIFHDARSRFGGKVLQVDVSGKVNAAQRVMDAIRGGAGDGEVDWLGQVARNNDLKRFFSY